MKIIITSLQEDERGYAYPGVKALKALRSISPLPLNEAKGIVNGVIAGQSIPVELGRGMSLSKAQEILDEAGVGYRLPSRLSRLGSRIWALRPPRPRLPMSLKQGIPVYVTRKTADGGVASWSVNAWFGLVVFVLVQLNVLFWSIVGLVTAVRILL